MPDSNITVQRKQADKDKEDLVSRLVTKRRRMKTVKLNIDGSDIELQFGAISAKYIDRLYSENPPSPEQKIKGLAFNPDDFNPALISACSVEPKISEEDARDIFSSENWSSGELGYLVDVCSNLCLQGLDIPFSARG